jgi:O-antigen ligase
LNREDLVSSASLPIAARVTGLRVALASPVAARIVVGPSLLLLLGSAVGYLGTLDARVAQERLIGVLVAAVLSVVAVYWLRKAEVLVWVAAIALLGALWVIAAAGAEVFRGPVGAVLRIVFWPVLGVLPITDPVEITNTRFIVGYNGLADLCLVAIFSAGALLLGQYGRRRLLVGFVVVAAVLLLGTGSRGALTGLAAGVCLIGLYMWPRRYALLVVVLAPLATLALMVGALDKGLEFSSTAGRFAYWMDLARLLVEYPFTGVGLGVDTANSVALLYEINPDPERIYYAHNTFVQAYLEQGPLGLLGMLLLPGLAVFAAVLARRHGIVLERRALLVAGLGTVGALTAHGLTDQVVTTNVGTALLLLGLVAILVSLPPASLASLWRFTARSLVAVAALVAVSAVVTLIPSVRAQLLLNVGGLQANRALLLDAQASVRPAALEQAETTLLQALALSPEHPAVLRNLARVRSARYDDFGALSALTAASQSARLDGFDMLQIAHAYRDAGLPTEAYLWASRAYELSGRSREDVVMRTYAENTLTDDEGGHRARTLAAQAEAAMTARRFAEAESLFSQALSFKPDNAYLQDRLGGAQRAVAKYGPGD